MPRRLLAQHAGEAGQVARLDLPQLADAPST
jgi:hypothetical protein